MPPNRPGQRVLNVDQWVLLDPILLAIGNLVGNILHQILATAGVLAVQIMHIRTHVVERRRGHFPADIPCRLETELFGSLHVPILRPRC